MTTPEKTDEISAFDATVGFYGEAFFDEMRAGREMSRRLGEVIHDVVGAPQTALDLGAGVGIQTGRLQELGWTIDGGDFAPLAVEGREPGVTVVPFDLTLPGGGPNKRAAVDCVICTEVAEHVPERYSHQVIQNITSLARKFIVWSAAPPGQGGTGHINLQPPDFWLGRFKAANWVPSAPRTMKLRALMRERQAQHCYYADNFFVLMPVDNTEEFYDFMRSCRNNYRLLADAIHQVVGLQETAVDIGCGIGAQTARLKEHGWRTVGADFSPAAREMREPGLDVVSFDLTRHNGGYEPGLGQVDCVICTETAEHIPAEHADTIVDNVTRLARNTIVWSAACPWQVEPYHINLQYPPYWLERFEARGWMADPKQSARLQQLMLDTKAQHYLGRENFFVLVKKEPPPHFTIVSTVLNGELWIDKHIESVMGQSYLNFSHVIIDAWSDDQTEEIALQMTKEDPRVRVLHNSTERLSSLENCWSIWKDLPDDEVIVWLDGDDWFAHDRALEVLAKAYQNPNVWLTFGQFMFSDGEVGFAGPYPPGAHARFMDWRATHLKTFRAGLVKKLGGAYGADGPRDPVCLLQPGGQWVEHATDKAIMWPLLEMAGDRYICIYQVLSVYNMTNCTARAMTPELQTELGEVERLRSLPPFQRLVERPW